MAQLYFTTLYGTSNATYINHARWQGC